MPNFLVTMETGEIIMRLRICAVDGRVLVSCGARAAPMPPVEQINPGMAERGKKSTIDENARIVAFLKTLTGDQPLFTLRILPPFVDATRRLKPFNH
jgi:hypothetical protein